MDTMTNAMAGFDIGMPTFPSFHFTVSNGELRPNFCHTSANVTYDSPPINRKPRLLKQTSLDETNRKQVPNLPMRKKSEPTTPPIPETPEPLIEGPEDSGQNHKTDENQNATGKKKKRRVSFADACGKELTHVQIFEEDQVNSKVKDNDWSPEMKPLEMVLPLLPFDSETFKERFKTNHIILEKLNLGITSVTGRIRIQQRPGGEERRVAVRYTKDGWMSFTKQPARPIPKMEPDTLENSQSELESDLYCFDIGLDKHSPAIQFFLVSCDSRGKAEFEDNNDGEMYTVINTNYVEPPPPLDEEEGEWEAYMMGKDEWCNDYY